MGRYESKIGPTNNTIAPRGCIRACTGACSGACKGVCKWGCGTTCYKYCSSGCFVAANKIGPTSVY